MDILIKVIDLCIPNRYWKSHKIDINNRIILKKEDRCFLLSRAHNKQYF